MHRSQLPPADKELIHEDGWHAKKQREQMLKEMGLYSHRVIMGWYVLTENLEMKLLELLLRLKSANVYEISKSKDVGHYSTVLRGLRRMEKKNLVHSILKNAQGRYKKIYYVTLLGRLLVYLAKDGWKGTAQKIAQESSNFRDCQTIHELYDPVYYWHFTKNILETLIQKTSNNQEIDLELIVSETEFNQIEIIIERLSQREQFAESTEILERLAKVRFDL